MINKQNDRLEVKSNPNSIISASYQYIKTNIELICLEKKIKTIMIASAVPCAGLNINTANIALALANSKRRVVIVDCDLHIPSIHQIFKSDFKPGLTNVLVVDEKVSEVMRQANNLNLNLYYIPSGVLPPNPSVLIGSDKMKALLIDLKKHTDIIILHSPPIIGFADTLELARLADGVILVLNAGIVTWDSAKHAKKLLEKIKANILGVIVSNVNPKKEEYYQIFHQYNYKRYYKF